MGFQPERRGDTGGGGGSGGFIPQKKEDLRKKILLLRVQSLARDGHLRSERTPWGS